MGMDRDPNVYDRDPLAAGRETPVVDRDTGSSNFMAFLIGGLVIAIGLLAFLFYDGGSSTHRDVNTTSSTTRSAPATPGTATGGAITAPAPAPAGSGASTSAPTTGTAAPSRP
jgi:hypothetical protein